MTTSTFNLYSLPLLPVSEIFKNMTVQELIHISYENQDIQQFMKKIPIRSGGFKVVFDEEGITIHMNKLPYTFQRSLHFSIDKSTLLNTFWECYEYLKKVFQGEINNLEVCPLTFSNHFHQIPQECQVLSIGKSSDFYPEYDLDHLEECSEDMLNSLLDKINFKKGLCLNGPLELRTQNEKVFTIDWLKINNSGWMNLNYLKALRNEVVALQDGLFTNQEINEFLHNLKNGTGNQKLKVMTIMNQEEFDMEIVLQGLECFEIKKKRFELKTDSQILIEEFLPFGNQSGTDLRDINTFERSDGIRISVEQVFGSLRVYVWNQDSKKRAISHRMDGPLLKKHRSH